MLFQEALEQLQTGEAMCREVWSQEDGYLKLMPGMKHVWKVVLHPAPNAANYIFSLEDLISSDWKKFEITGTVVEDCSEVQEAA